MTLRTKLYKYQLQGYRQIERFDGRCLLADDPGLGKSLQALYYAHNNPELRPMIVVCPATLKWNWSQEALKHFGWRTNVLEKTRPPAREMWEKHSITIVNYDILGQTRRVGGGAGWMDYLEWLEPKLIVIDESHFLANRGAARTKWVRQLCKGTERVIALSGTPIVNRPAEMWTTLNILRPDLYPSFWQFGHEFCGPTRNYYSGGWDFRGATNIPRLHKDLLRTMMIRRRKEDVLKELPNKNRIVLPFKVPDMTEYRQLLNDFASWLEENKPDKMTSSLKAEAVTKLGYLKRTAARLKLPLVMQWLDEFLKTENGKVIVFAIHKDIVRELQKRYRKICVTIVGGTPMKNRKAAVKTFQEASPCRVFIGNIKAAGVGITLTAASTVVFCEFDWVPGNHTQAEDRGHRISQKSQVNVYYTVAMDTVEMEIAKIIEHKQQIVKGVLDGEDKGDKLNVYDQLLKSIIKERRNGETKKTSDKSPAPARQRSRPPLLQGVVQRAGAANDKGDRRDDA